LLAYIIRLYYITVQKHKVGLYIFPGISETRRNLVHGILEPCNISREGISTSPLASYLNRMPVSKIM
jgi:hypothetical protein